MATILTFAIILVSFAVSGAFALYVNLLARRRRSSGYRSDFRGDVDPRGGHRGHHGGWGGGGGHGGGGHHGGGGGGHGGGGGGHHG